MSNEYGRGFEDARSQAEKLLETIDRQARECEGFDLFHLRLVRAHLLAVLDEVDVLMERNDAA